MNELAQQVVSGLATGSVFASLALALVLIYRAMGIINFAQGELAMFTTYIAWQLVQNGMPMWAAFCITVITAFLIGVALERLVIRPVRHRPPLSVVIVTLGLFIAINGAAGWLWGFIVKPFPTPFSTTPLTIAGVGFSQQDLGVIAVSLAMLGLITLFFRCTTLGLAMRAAARYPDQCRVLGIRVGPMLALGWGLAAVVGAASGIMIAPVVFLDPNMMQTVLVYAFASAVLGGLESALGAVVGGLFLGVAINLLGTYVAVVGNELRLATALGIIVLVLLVRPQGLFGRVATQRV